MTDKFRLQHVLALQLQTPDIQFVSDVPTVSFLEVESVEDHFEQLTAVFQTTWQLMREISESRELFRIAAVSRDGPLLEVRTAGQLIADMPARVIVTSDHPTWQIAGIDISASGSEDLVFEPLDTDGSQFHGVFLPASPARLRVRVHEIEGQRLDFEHPYRLREVGDGIVEPIAGTEYDRFFAAAAAPDGRVWFGGEASAPRSIGRIWSLAADGRVIEPGFELLLPELPVGTRARIEDMAVDQLGRVHAAFLVRTSANRVVSNGDVVVDPLTLNACQTINMAADNYPLTTVDLLTDDIVPSPSTRLIAAADGDIWLFGSDGGVARVTDAFRSGNCPGPEQPPRYDPVFRRDTHPQLPTNTVPALAVGTEGTLWLGTALGVVRWQQGRFTPFPFNPERSLQGNPDSLERFFQEVAAAIFAARPVPSVRLGSVSFVEAFGGPLIKEDLIFSAVGDGDGVWVGTLGGGIRRIEHDRPPLHLTRHHGLISNLILDLDLHPEGDLWAATNEGVSHVQVHTTPALITNFGRVDGLATPVRDVVVGANGVVWLATDGGLFRIVRQHRSVQGRVVSRDGLPVAAADVVVLGTPFRTVTDENGYFTLRQLPLGTYQIRVEGRLATGGPYAERRDVIEVRGGDQVLDPWPLPRQDELELRPFVGDGRMVTVGTPVPLVAILTDTSGMPVEGIEVTFTVEGSDNSLSDTVVATGPDGQAATVFTVRRAGVNVVEATAGSAQTSFTVVGAADRDSPRLIRVSGDTQIIQPDDALTAPLVVQLVDQFSNPLEGEAVQAEVLQGMATFTPLPDSAAELGCPPLSDDPSVAFTNEVGLACFQLQAGNTEEVIVVRVEGLGRAVQFLTIVGSVDTPDVPLDIALHEEFIYVADRASGLRVVDIGNPQQPRDIGALDLPHAEHRVAIANNRAYQLNMTNDPVPLMLLYAVDITRPSDVPQPDEFRLGDTLPEVVRGALQVEVAGRLSAVDLDVANDLAYLITAGTEADANTLLIVDIQERAEGVTPFQVVGELVGLPGKPRDIAVSGSIAYIPVDSGQLLVVDVSEPTRPVVLDPLAPERAAIADLNAFRLMIDGSVAYVASQDRFTILDLTLPTAPRLQGTLRVSVLPFSVETGKTMAIVGNILYLVRYARGLEAIDVRDRDRPRSVGRLDTPSQAFSVVAGGQFLYVTDFIFGLQMVRGPDEDALDSDGDGVSDFFDAFPLDPDAFRDTDEDGIGDQADADDDNDGFTDAEEIEADTDPTDPNDFPLTLPPLGVSAVVVDAGSELDVRERDGSAEAPYLSLTQGLRALRLLAMMGRHDANTLIVRTGIYSPSTTQERFPLDLRNLNGLTIRGAGAAQTVIDAGSTGQVILFTGTDLTIDDLSLVHGGSGLLVLGASDVTLQRTRIAEHIFTGVVVSSASQAVSIQDSLIEQNGGRGMVVFGSEVRLADNTIQENQGEGLRIAEGSTAEIIQNAIRNNGEHGIMVRLASTARLMLNTIEGNMGDGVVASREATVDATDNTVSSNGVDGVMIRHQSRAILTSNRIMSSRDDGIYLFDASVAEVRDNTIAGHGDDGIFVQRDSQATIVDNRFSDNTDDSIFVETSTVEVAGNVIVSSGNRAALVRRSSTATITDNVIQASGGEGLVISEEATAVLSGNIVEASTANGIRVNESACAVIRAGSVIDSEGNGILVSNQSRARIGDTGDVMTVARNREFGILIRDDAQAAQIDVSRIVLDRNGLGTIGGDFTAPTGDANAYCNEMPQQP